MVNGIPSIGWKTLERLRWEFGRGTEPMRSAGVPTEVWITEGDDDVRRVD